MTADIGPSFENFAEPSGEIQLPQSSSTGAAEDATEGAAPWFAGVSLGSKANGAASMAAALQPRKGSKARSVRAASGDSVLPGMAREGV
jgi:hypothetical protein